MSALAAVICSDSAVDFNVGIERQLDSFRAARREIEASVLPLATSVDGRRFTFQASLYSLQLQVGGYAVLDDGGGVPRLGQVLALEMDQQPGAELMLPLSAGPAWPTPGASAGTPSCAASRGRARPTRWVSSWSGC